MKNYSFELMNMSKLFTVLIDTTKLTSGVDTTTKRVYDVKNINKVCQDWEWIGASGWRDVYGYNTEYKNKKSSEILFELAGRRIRRLKMKISYGDYTLLKKFKENCINLQYLKPTLFDITMKDIHQPLKHLTQLESLHILDTFPERLNNDSIYKNIFEHLTNNIEAISINSSSLFVRPFPSICLKNFNGLSKLKYLQIQRWQLDAGATTVLSLMTSLDTLDIEVGKLRSSPCLHCAYSG
ncbi:hypothetical protein HCN44_000345 [Aphidius gifuensis]|uniref:Uncharacterized protein n=1 Tax=Aphidius gifuensis TaxID=684658 RepID=A0A834XNS7_APHGI|nr:hypothetical protein HCN44_000345 [Aphidius gifuensis]